jgi:predicted nucleic acid-binding protein
MIFIDSSYIIALVVQSDQWHKDAVRLIETVGNSNKIITEAMIIESINMIGKCKGGTIGNKIYNYVTQNYKIHNPPNLLKQAMIEFLKYDGTISLADSTAIIAMHDLGIHEIVSFDTDFDKVDGIIRIQ